MAHVQKMCPTSFWVVSIDVIDGWGGSFWMGQSHSTPEFFFFLVVGNEEIRLSLNRLTDAVTVTFSVFNFLHPRIGQRALIEQTCLVGCQRRRESRQPFYPADSLIDFKFLAKMRPSLLMNENTRRVTSSNLFVDVTEDEGHFERRYLTAVVSF